MQERGAGRGASGDSTDQRLAKNLRLSKSATLLPPPPPTRH